MRVIPPLAITNARLTSTTAPEPGVGEAAFNIATSYSADDKVIIGSPSSPVTITLASPGVLSWADHGLADATPVVLTTTGALPTGLTGGVRYFIVNRAEDTFQLSATEGGAPIVTSVDQSGTHTATAEIHRTFLSLEDTNLGNSPMISPDKWADAGPTNAWAMFDLLRNTATTVASPLTVVIIPGVRIDSIALVGLVADSVTVEVSVLGSPIYTFTQSLRTRIVTSWYEHFFAPFTTAGVFALIDLPPVTNAVITITLTRASGDVSCGGLVLGMAVDLGTTLLDPLDDAKNYSKIDRDDFGDSILIPRRTVPKVNLQTRCKKGDVVRIRKAREDLNATPAMWLGLDDPADGYFESVQILGIYKQFSINLDQPNDALVTLELEEV